MGKIYVGDRGTEIRLETGVGPIDTASIRYRKPGGETGEWTAEVDGTAVVYRTVDGDLDTAGTWKLQAFGTLPSGWSGLGETVEMTVSKVFK